LRNHIFLNVSLVHISSLKNLPAGTSRLVEYPQLQKNQDSGYPLIKA
jgi:hypothetical protein